MYCVVSGRSSINWSHNWNNCLQRPLYPAVISEDGCWTPCSLALITSPMIGSFSCSVTWSVADPVHLSYTKSVEMFVTLTGLFEIMHRHCCVYVRGCARFQRSIPVVFPTSDHLALRILEVLKP